MDRDPRRHRGALRHRLPHHPPPARPEHARGIGWSAVYIAIPVAFGGWLWWQYGSQQGVEYYTGYLVEKSLSVDNLFVFIILLSAFAVPRELRQRVLLIGVGGALVLRGIFIALGAQMIASFAWTFLLFGAILLVTAVKVGRDALSHTDHSHRRRRAPQRAADPPLPPRHRRVCRHEPDRPT